MKANMTEMMRIGIHVPDSSYCSGVEISSKRLLACQKLD